MTSHVGQLIAVDLFDCDSAGTDDPECVLRCLRNAAESAAIPVLSELVHHFSPQGVTAIVLLAESHAAIHTWPELKLVTLDVFTCGSPEKGEAMVNHLIGSLRPRRFERSNVTRGDILTPQREERLKHVVD